MGWDPCQFGDLPLGLTKLLKQKLWYVIGNLSCLKQTSRFCRKLIHVSCKVTFLPFEAFHGIKIGLALVFPPDILVSYVVFEIPMKIWPCSLWIEIFVNLGIYFLFWPAFCHGNVGKFYLKPYPCYINFWYTKTLLCKLWG